MTNLTTPTELEANAPKWWTNYDYLNEEEAVEIDAEETVAEETVEDQAFYSINHRNSKTVDVMLDGEVCYSYYIDRDLDNDKKWAVYADDHQSYELEALMIEEVMCNLGRNLHKNLSDAQAYAEECAKYFAQCLFQNIADNGKEVWIG
jgi:hypothetical protein